MNDEVLSYYASCQVLQDREGFYIADEDGNEIYESRNVRYTSYRSAEEALDELVAEARKFAEEEGV